MSDVVIKVENLSKQYRLGVINHGTLAKDLQAWWAKKRGKEDPNSQISPHPNLLPKKEKEFNTSPCEGEVGCKPGEGGFYALRDINFEVKQGEVLGIIGSNGAGKSTLLKILSRVTSPTSGSIKIKGRIGSLLEVGTGFHPELTGRENIYLNGAILGMKRWEIDKKLDEIIDFSGVEKFIDTPVKRYSSGMYVRLAFAVAAHLDPEILVVDEVLAVGDAEFQKKCLGKMDAVSKKEGRTVLFVSHNMAAILKLCTKSIVIEKGELSFFGKTNKAVELYVSKEIKDFNKMSQNFTSRSGSKDALIKLIIINPSMPETGRSLDVRFYVNSNKELNDVSLAISFRDNFGNPLFQLFSEHMMKKYSLKKGDNEFSVRVENLPLIEGVYRMNAWLGQNSIKSIDFIEDVMLFKVYGGKISEGNDVFLDNRGYPMIVKGDWSGEEK